MKYVPCSVASLVSMKYSSCFRDIPVVSHVRDVWFPLSHEMSSDIYGLVTAVCFSLPNDNNLTVPLAVTCGDELNCSSGTSAKAEFIGMPKPSEGVVCQQLLQYASACFLELLKSYEGRGESQGQRICSCQGHLLPRRQLPSCSSYPKLNLSTFFLSNKGEVKQRIVINSIP